jgi:rhamnogalacturonyl hydrolase YesR
MAPPFLCKYGEVDEALLQIKGLRKYLYNEEKRLLSHIWDESKNAFGRVDFWGVGNGWALAGLHGVYTMLGADRKDDKEYISDYIKALLDGCIKYQS